MTITFLLTDGETEDSVWPAQSYTAEKAIIQAFSDLSPSWHFPLLAQKRVWVGDAVGKGVHTDDGAWE